MVLFYVCCIVGMILMFSWNLYGHFGQGTNLYGQIYYLCIVGKFETSVYVCMYIKLFVEFNVRGYE